VGTVEWSVLAIIFLFLMFFGKPGGSGISKRMEVHIRKWGGRHTVFADKTYTEYAVDLYADVDYNAEFGTWNVKRVYSKGSDGNFWVLLSDQQKIRINSTVNRFFDDARRERPKP
jgi:hypothetical protein